MAIEERFGRLDILINAATNPPRRDAGCGERSDKTFDVNLRAFFMTCRAAHGPCRRRLHRERRRSTVSGLHRFRAYTHHQGGDDIHDPGLRQGTRRQEHRVNAFPGLVDTHFSKPSWKTKTSTTCGQDDPLARHARPQEISGNHSISYPKPPASAGACCGGWRDAGLRMGVRAIMNHVWSQMESSIASFSVHKRSFKEGSDMRHTPGQKERS